MKERILYYKGRGHKDAERLRTILESTVHSHRLDVHETVESLSHRLREMGHGVGIAVLFVAEREELSNILAISDLLFGIDTILILPNGNRGIVTRALTLRPRFLSYAHSSFVDVAMVLDNMIAQMTVGKER